MGQKSLPTTPNIHNTTPNIHSAEAEKLFRDLTAAGVEVPLFKMSLMFHVYMCMCAYTCECAFVCVCVQICTEGKGWLQVSFPTALHLFFETESLTEPGTHIFSFTD